MWGGQRWVDKKDLKNYMARLTLQFFGFLA